MASPHGLIPAGSVVLDRGNAPGSAVDTGLNPAASALRTERAPAGGVLHAWRGLHLPSSPASIIAQRVDAILPSSYPSVYTTVQVTPRDTVGLYLDRLSGFGVHERGMGKDHPSSPPL